MASSFDQLESVTPTQDESNMARESSHKLARLLGGVDVQADGDGRPTETVTMEIRLNSEHELVSIPASVLRMMGHILSQMAQGHMVTVVPRQCEMTTRQAAEVLNVSRPFLIELLEKGKIPFRKVGTHRRIQFGDVSAYRKKMEGESAEALAALIAEGEELESKQ